MYKDLFFRKQGTTNLGRGGGKSSPAIIFFFAASPNMFKDQENTYLVEFI